MLIYGGGITFQPVLIQIHDLQLCKLTLWVAKRLVQVLIASNVLYFQKILLRKWNPGCTDVLCSSASLGVGVIWHQWFHHGCRRATHTKIFWLIFWFNMGAVIIMCILKVIACIVFDWGQLKLYTWFETIEFLCVFYAFFNHKSNLCVWNEIKTHWKSLKTS